MREKPIAYLLKSSDVCIHNISMPNMIKNSAFASCAAALLFDFTAYNYANFAELLTIFFIIVFAKEAEKNGKYTEIIDLGQIKKITFCVCGGGMCVYKCAYQHKRVVRVREHERNETRNVWRM